MKSSPTNEGGHFKVKNVPERKCFFFQNFQRRVQGFYSVVVVVAFESLSRNDYSILCGVDSSATGWSITVTCSTSKRRKSCVSVSWTCHGVSYCLLWSPQLKCLTLRALWPAGSKAWKQNPSNLIQHWQRQRKKTASKSKIKLLRSHGENCIRPEVIKTG